MMKVVTDLLNSCSAQCCLSQHPEGHTPVKALCLYSSLSKREMTKSSRRGGVPDMRQKDTEKEGKKDGHR